MEVVFGLCETRVTGVAMLVGLIFSSQAVEDLYWSVRSKFRTQVRVLDVWIFVDAPTAPTALGGVGFLGVLTCFDVLRAKVFLEKLAVFLRQGVVDQKLVRSRLS